MQGGKLNRVIMQERMEWDGASAKVIKTFDLRPEAQGPARYRSGGKGSSWTEQQTPIPEATKMLVCVCEDGGSKACVFLHFLFCFL